MILPADPLPPTHESDEPLPGSKRNLYGIIPADLNLWEQHFAQVLDHDTSDAVTWWHRNQPHTPWAVNVLLPDGRGWTQIEPREIYFHLRLAGGIATIPARTGFRSETADVPFRVIQFR